MKEIFYLWGRGLSAPRRWSAWGVFLLALLTYLLTLEPDASFWDCPEYLVTAALLEIGHPPGNPVWTLTAHIFALFGGTDPQHIAIAVNLSSAIFMAGAAALLCSVMYILLGMLHLGARTGRLPRALIAMATGLLFAWSDSAWFSAVEAEVYAMSLFLTALTVRLMLGWVFIRQRPRAGRQLLLIVYLTGLSIGVHQLNLLVIPALALIWLFRRYHRPGPGRIIATLVISAVAVGGILLGFMPGVIWLAGRVELLCVNHLHLPIHSGVWLFWALALLLGAVLPLLGRLSRRPRLRLLSWVPMMLLIGYSSYMLILVRGAANPPMNEGAPTHIFALAEYLNRDQYGKTPLFYGRTPHSRPMRQERILPDGTADYSRYARRVVSPRYAPAADGRSYRHFDDNAELIYTPELNMLLPRLTSSNPADIESYADWAGMTEDAMQSVEISYALDSLGKPVGRLLPDGSRARETELRPTRWQNIRYLLGYQIGYMYFRYLLWNYGGRQNDRFAAGEVEHGNFIIGIAPIDAAMLGPQDAMPDEIGESNPGRNRLYMIPLLIGIAGMVLLQRSGRTGRRANLIIMMLFIMTGLAIVLYLNQSPREPRERDYSFLGSFWAYAAWIGAGLAWTLRVRAPRPLRRVLPWLTLLLPAWMLAVNYDDHDRSHRAGVSHYAANLLNSLEPDAILFTNGDNYTFPLWWAQEVAGVRRDVTVINTAYLATPWYVEQLMRDNPGRFYDRIAYPDAPVTHGLKMQLRGTDHLSTSLAATPYQRLGADPTRLDTLAAADALRALRNRYADLRGGGIPAMLRIANPEVPGDSIYVRASAVASGSSSIGRRQLATLDIIATNAASLQPRPVYWLSLLSSADYGGMYPFTARGLHTRRLVYADTLTDAIRNRLLDADLRGARLNLSGNLIKESMKERGIADSIAERSADIYADASFGPQLTTQRLGLLRLARRLLDAGRMADALEVTLIVLRDYPPTTWEYQVCNESEGTIHEGEELASLLIATAPAGGPDSTYLRRRGEELRRREAERAAQWRRYNEALPPRLRGVLTPKHRQYIRHISNI